jgi:glycosyltransferase involved in cell wall biosynthesis
MPLVSINMPAYNRADTILRAIRSIQAQTFTDWELIIVDDGSTDNTVELIEGCDPRLKLIRQENQGMAGARNTALRASTGAYIAFLDSDDEWLPHHLELSVSFLEAFPEEQFVINELWEDLGGGRIVNHYRAEISDWYPRTARRIGSRMLDLPPGEQDGYLRVYQSRQPIGEWGRTIVARTPYQNVFHYRGRIFEQLRWGYLMCVQSTMIRRAAIDVTGEFDSAHDSGADYGFSFELCRHFPANYLSIPACIKHELTEDGVLPSESHVATGSKTGLKILEDMLYYLEHHWAGRRDREISALCGLRRLSIAQLALVRSERSVARKYLKAARRDYPELRPARYLDWFLTLIPSGTLACRLYTLSFKAAYMAGMIQRREVSIGEVVRKVTQRLFNVSLRQKEVNP